MANRIRLESENPLLPKIELEAHPELQVKNVDLIVTAEFNDIMIAFAYDLASFQLSLFRIGKYDYSALKSDDFFQVNTIITLIKSEIQTYAQNFINNNSKNKISDIILGGK